MKDLERLAAVHYENFPVGSIFIGREFRKAIRLIYAYARVADDIADEGDESPEEKIRLLNSWEERLISAVEKKGGNAFFTNLVSAIDQHQIPLEHFKDILIAFRMDAQNTRYQSFDELLNYCRYSANPIGRIVLSVTGESAPEKDRYSDAICTALQLANFWQDISVDTVRNRLYIPEADLRRFNVTFDDIASKKICQDINDLVEFQVNRTRSFFIQGLPLLTMVGHSLRKELRLTWHGGMRVLEKIAGINYDTIHQRPVLTAADRIIILFRAVARKVYGTTSGRRHTGKE